METCLVFVQMGCRLNLIDLNLLSPCLEASDCIAQLINEWSLKSVNQIIH